MENWLIEILNLPQACEVEEILPKGFLSSNFELDAGEINLQNHTIKEIAIVGAIGSAYGQVPASETIENGTLLVVEITGGKFEKHAQKVAEMLQNHLPQHLMIGITDGENACIQMAIKEKTADGLIVKEQLMSPLISEDKVEEISAKLNFNDRIKTDMQALWNDYFEQLSQL